MHAFSSVKIIFLEFPSGINPGSWKESTTRRIKTILRCRRKVFVRLSSQARGGPGIACSATQVVDYRYVFCLLRVPQAGHDNEPKPLEIEDLRRLMQEGQHVAFVIIRSHATVDNPGGRTRAIDESTRFNQSSGKPFQIRLN